MSSTAVNNPYAGMHHIENPRMAPVIPLRLLAQMGDEQLASFGNYHLMLAHDVVENLDRAASVARKWRWIGQKASGTVDILMDNSLVELGNAVNLEMLRKACEPFVATPGIRVTLVLADVLGNGEASREASRDMLRSIYIKGDQDFWKKIELAYVAQGKDWNDYLQSLEDFRYLSETYPEIKMLMVPRRHTADMGTRVPAIRMAGAFTKPGQRIHMLGFSDSISDDIMAASFSVRVSGIDSAVPYRMDGFNLFDECPPRGDWWEKGELTPRALQNHDMMNKLLSNIG